VGCSSPLALLRAAGSGGTLTTDALVAAVALRHGAVVHTADSDFARFPKVRWHNPLRG
jgi:predicted nucleic acid-binding protein